MDQEKDTLDLGWLIKSAAAFLGSLITVAIIGIWTTVNTTNVEIVRLQSRLISVEEKIVAHKDSYDDKLKILSDRVTILEQRYNR